jgi:hypothetical protein
MAQRYGYHGIQWPTRLRSLSLGPCLVEDGSGADSGVKLFKRNLAGSSNCDRAMTCDSCQGSACGYESLTQLLHWVSHDCCLVTDWRELYLSSRL